VAAGRYAQETLARKAGLPSAKVSTMMSNADMALKKDSAPSEDSFVRALFKLTHRDMGSVGPPSRA
jgi:catalase (peroxidase I)